MSAHPEIPAPSRKFRRGAALSGAEGMGTTVETNDAATVPAAAAAAGPKTEKARARVPVLIAGASVGLAASAAIDEANVRRIRQALRTAGFRISSAADELEGLIDVCIADPPDALVAACERDGLVSASRIREARSRLSTVPMIVVLPSTDRRSLRRAIAAGIEGCVREADIEEVLALTVASVIVGQLSVPGTLRQPVVTPGFSHREKQVLELVARGLTNGEIAQELYLAESTVKSHLSSSFRKLGVNSRQEAAAIVLDPEHGLAGHFASSINSSTAGDNDTGPRIG